MKLTGLRILSLGLLLGSGTSMAADADLPLTIRVIDSSGEPISGAAIRNPKEQLRHGVNHHTGAWTARSLYPMNGPEEVLFQPGDSYLFDVSAPGYVSRIFAYEIQARRNVVEVTLTPLSDIDLQRCGGELVPLHAPAGAVSALPFSIEEMSRLGDLTQADPWLSASFSVHLLGLGAAHAEQAVDWAELAVNEAQGELSGDDFVSLKDQMFRVRAVALNLRWQTLELDRLRERRHAISPESENARSAAASVAEEWVWWTEAAGTDPTLAQALCLSASEHPRRCDL